MPYIKDETEHLENESEARAAIFYSISSTQKGLQGIDLGNFLIKEVAKALKQEHTQLEIFSTLSPIPNFVSWLQTHRNSKSQLIPNDKFLERLNEVLISRSIGTVTGSAVDKVLNVLEVTNWHEDMILNDAVKPILLRLGAHYVYNEKKRGKALCQVANFHIRNGAIFEQLNWLGNPTPKVGTG